MKLRYVSFNRQLQQKMVSAVENEGIEIQRFNGILNAHQDSTQELDASEDEFSKFAAANQAIEQIQNQAQQDIQEVITDSGLTVVRYQKIIMAVRNDPELSQKLQKLMGEED
jgi:hypothetical protein